MLSYVWRPFFQAGFVLLAAANCLSSANLITSGSFEESNQPLEKARYWWRSSGYAASFEAGGTVVFGSAGGTQARLTFPGAASGAEPRGEGLSAEQGHYYIGASEQWRSASHFERIRYKEVYPGIDVVFVSNAGRLEYNFEVAAHAEARLIRMRYQSAKVNLDRAGNLVVDLGETRIVQNRPEAYQGEGRGRRGIGCGYRLKETGEVELRTGGYDRNRALVIDPVLVFSTYLGGSSFDAIYGAAADAAGNLYVVGETASGSLTNTAVPSRSSRDVFVAKLNASGTQVLYTAYLGGSGMDSGRAIAVDAVGNAYVTGVTSSGDFPVTGGVLSTRNGGEADAFVAKLDPTGHLLYSTYLGGEKSDYGFSIGVDGSGAAYVVGQTGSTGFPVTAGALQVANHGGMSDCFVSKLNAAGSGLVYSTLLGGSGLDTCAGVTLDAGGNAYVGGTTYSWDFPAQAGLQSGLGGTANAFAAKINAAGTGLVYATYLGGSGLDNGNAVALDAGGALYVAGYTSSVDFPVSGGAAQSVLKGSYNAFVSKITADGGALAYSTLLGGTRSDTATSIAVDASGRAILGGYTTSPDFPVVAGAVQGVFQGAFDGFAAVLDGAGASLVFSSYFGGSGDDRAYAVAGLGGNNLMLAGTTASGNFPAVSALQNGLSVANDAFALVVNYAASVSVATPGFNPPAGTYTTAQTVTLSSATAGAWICYTTDGSTPSATAGTVYSGPIAVSANTTIKAMAYASGMTDSAVSTAAYTIGGGGPAWYDSAWSSRKAVTIDHTKVVGGGNLNNFPLLFSVTDASLKTAGNGGGMGKADGTDLLFTAADGVTKLNHELESYNGAAGQVAAWVRIPVLSGSSDTVIYVYYGNAGAASQQNAAGTWDGSFKTVWHFAGGTASDSTAAGNQGKLNGAAVAAAGQIGGGANFNGAGSITANAAGVVASGGWTVSLWAKLNAAASLANLLNLADAAGQTMGICYWYQGLLCQRGAPVPANATLVANPPGVGGWHLYTFAYDGVSQAMKIYVDGVDRGGVNGSGVVWTGYGANQFALSYGVGGGFAAPLSVDEVRLSNQMRSPGWIATEYNNQNSPGTFAAFGGGGGSQSSAATPGFNPPAGVYTTAQTVTLSSATAGAWMRYTTDGSTPSATAGTVYSAPIAVSANTTIQAIAYASGMTDSAVGTAAYTISGGGGGGGGPAWYDSAWSSRKAVTIDHTKVGGGSNLNNFPLLFSVTDASLKTAGNGGGMGKADGTDLLFTAADGVSKLNHELESYNGAAGQVAAWVRIPALSASSDTVIYVYYGNASAANQQNAAGTWDGSFKTVWHFAGGTASDSTAAGNQGKLNGAAVAAAGQIGGGANFNGAGSITANAAGVVASGGWTVSLWAKLNAAASLANLFNLADAAGQTAGICYWYGGLLCQRGAPVTANSTLVSNPPGVGGWHLYTFAYDGVSQAMKIYVDGVDRGGVNSSGVVWTGYGANQFALSYGVGGGFAAPMSVDEVRLSNQMRSPGWIATEFNNQNSPGTFAAFGGGGGSQSSVATPGFNPPAGTYTTAQTVTLSSATAGASMRYTTDGSAPSSTAGTVYSGPIAVSANTTIKALAYASGMTDSAVSTAAYTISPPMPAAAPGFNPPGGLYNSAQTVTLSSATAGASMRYTTDGSAPSSTAGTVYSAPIAVSANTTIQAIAYASGMTDSAVGTAAYTISGGGGGGGGPAWYDSAWSSRKAVTIDHTKVGGGSNLNNFPLLFSVTDASLKTAGNGGGMGKADGTDLLFTAADGVSKLNHELESYNGAAGQVAAWVRIPALSASSDTVIYVYYGNASAANQQNAAGTWDGSFKTVWHFAGGTASDSTAAGNQGKLNGAAVAAAGQIGGGANFNGAGSITANAAGVVASGGWTVSLWAKLNAAASLANLFNLADAAGQTAGICYWYGGLLCQRGAPVTANSTLVSNPPGVGGWHLYTFAYDGVSQAMKIYVDGVDRGGVNSSGVVWTGYGANQFALSYGVGGGFAAPMSVDEVRLSNQMRSPGWIATEFNNQNSPSTFYQTQ